MRPDDTDERAARTALEPLERALVAILDQHVEAYANQGEPRFGRYLALNATTSVLERLMAAVIEDEGDAGRHACQALIDHAQLRIASRPARVN